MRNSLILSLLFCKIGYNLKYLTAKLEENAAKRKKTHMKTFIILWLILGLFASIFVVATLMLSSRLSQEEGLSENYEDWKTKESAPEMYPPQVEQ